MSKEAEAVVAAADALLKAQRERHDTAPWPQKYGVCYGEVNVLQAAVDQYHKLAAGTPPPLPVILT